MPKAIKLIFSMIPYNNRWNDFIFLKLFVVMKHSVALAILDTERSVSQSLLFKKHYLAG